MKKILLVLTILLVVAALISIFIPTNIQAAPGGIEEAEGPRDPHFHTGGWTTCCNELPRACDSEAE